MVKSVIIRRLSVIFVLTGFFGLLVCASPDGSIMTATAETLAQPLAEPLTLPAAANPGDSTQASTSSQVYLPMTAANYPWRSPFGVESNEDWFPETTIYQRGVDLGIQWTRMGTWRISWRTLQPNEGDPIDWSKLVGFEKELRGLKAKGIRPVVIVMDSPRWATINDVRNDDQPTSCGPIREDKFKAYAEFVRALVNRYKTDEFNLHNWELGNEPDVDPDLVKLDSNYGCWGDIDNPLYGGEYYGEMLKVVTPAIKSADPSARVWIGGLLLGEPNTTNRALGKPELFLKGILESGAAPYFDVVPYHNYVAYLNQTIDHDLKAGSWVQQGGGTLGKANYLRQIMAEYGVVKELYSNEASLMCPSTIGGHPATYCTPPKSEFFHMQADHLVRTMVRALSGNISGISWYTLNGPGWRYVGLLTRTADPNPAYTAYKFLVTQLTRARYHGPINYGNGIEAHSFKRGNESVYIVWTIDAVPQIITIPNSKFIAAYTRKGEKITPDLVGNFYEFEIGFSPIYIIRKP